MKLTKIQEKKAKDRRGEVSYKVFVTALKKASKKSKPTSIKGVLTRAMEDYGVRCQLKDLADTPHIGNFHSSLEIKLALTLSQLHGTIEGESVLPDYRVTRAITAMQQKERTVF